MLPLITSLFSRSEDDSWSRLPGVQEVLLEHRGLARTGKLDRESLQRVAAVARARGLKTVLVWDLPATDEALSQGAHLIDTIDKSSYDAIRIQDPGIARYLMERLPLCPRHLVLETGNHNLAGIQAWIQEIEPSRVVLSNELPLDIVRAMRGHLKVEIEILALGRLLLFFSPRRLLSTLGENEDAEEMMERFLTSVQERKHFPVVENRHGTFMYYEKDLFLLPELAAIQRAGVDVARLDLRFYDGGKTSPALHAWLSAPTANHLAALKTSIGPKLTRGFFKSNRTDKQFSRLTNPHLEYQEGEAFLGTVLETQKGLYLALATERPMAVGTHIFFQTPEGLRMDHQIHWIRGAGGQKVTHAGPPGPWMVNPASRVSSGAKAYLRALP